MGTEEKSLAERDVIEEEAEHEDNQRHQEGCDQPQEGKRFLEVMRGEDLAKPLLETVASARLAGWRGRRWSGSRAGDRVGLRLAAKPAEPGARLDGLAAGAAEYGARFRHRFRTRQGGPIIRASDRDPREPPR